MTTIYILCLTNNKYYIGKTSNSQKRILNHFQHQGSAWTKKYKPISVEKVINNADNFDEDKWTIKYMQKYGIANVRGGSFCSIQLSKSNKETLQRMITGSSDCCYKCGQSGHYISQCPDAQQDHYSGNCYSYSGSGGEVSASGSNINTVVYTQNTKFPCSQCGRTFDTKKGAAYHKRFYCKKKTPEIKHTSSSYNDSSIHPGNLVQHGVSSEVITSYNDRPLPSKSTALFKSPDQINANIISQQLALSLSMKEKRRVVVGSRVRMIGGGVGKVAFVGPVHYTRGEFVGVVLDLPVGKNNGYLQGVRYFECDLNHGMMARRLELKVI